MKRVFLICFLLANLAFAQNTGATSDTASADLANATFLNANRPVDERVNDLVSRMTMEEKVSQMVHTAAAIPRLGIPEYNWWSEGLHGDARAGISTVFPQAIGVAAAFDPELLRREADVMATEFRAKYRDRIEAKGYSDWYHGLTVWSPNINIFRDPRWGRGQETYGEDPFLTAQMGSAYVTGLQGSDPRYLKALATPKHFAVHSGPEPTRHTVDVQVSNHDLEDTYLPAFRATAMAGAGSVMCAYNSIDGKPACAQPMLLEEHLRQAWGFQGYVVSDCGAASDISQGHHFTRTMEEGMAAAVKAGMDIICAWPEEHITIERDALLKAVHDGLLSTDDIDRSVRRLFTARIKLGMFDPPQQVPYSTITMAENDTDAHRQLAHQAAQESLVLLKNEDHLLPIGNKYRTIAVIGPNADSVDPLLGNYNGTPSRPVTILEGIRRRFSNSTVYYARGSSLTGPAETPIPVEYLKADLIVVVLGLSGELEGEEMSVQIQGFSGGDRTSLDLPRAQQGLLETLVNTGKPVVLVLMNGSALAVNWADQHAPAILEAWYPGEEGGTAVAEALAGDFSPGGKLPLTFYKSVDQLPPFDDYNMKSRTYRYFTGEPLYPFGYGLSYTNFSYSNLRFEKTTLQASDELTASVDVRNTGQIAGDEVVQVYLTHPGVEGAALRSLCGFRRVHIEPGATQTVQVTVPNRGLSVVTPDGTRKIVPGELQVWVGAGQPVGRDGLAKTPGVWGSVKVQGEAVLPK